MIPDLYSKDVGRSLDKFVEQMRFNNKADRPELVFQQAIKWTKAQPLLTKKLLQYILQYKKRIISGSEAEIIEKIIKNRLIKEFKHDELTLPIRKLLYAKDLASLLKRNRGKFTRRSQTYLENLQGELSLTNLQCQAIKKYYFKSISANNLADSQPEIKLKTSPAARDSYQDLLLLIEDSPIYYQLATSDRATIFNRPRNNWLVKKRFWFGAIVLGLLWILLRNSDWKEPQIFTATDAIEGPSSCINLTGDLSSRMSLGDKLLSQNIYSDFLPSGKIPLYEATAAFARCNYSTARNKFATALKVEKNNPEALIYLNNAEAIIDKHLKIVVSVPLGSKPEIAWEILRGVAQAQTEINQQGGIVGKLLLIQIVDDDNEPDIVRQLAEQLVGDRSVLAVIGHNGSNASLAGSEIYQQHGLVMVSPTSSSTELSNAGNYIMRTAPSVTLLANALSNYASVNSLKRIAVCSDSQSSASVSFVREFTAEIELSGREIISIECDFANNNFNPIPVVEQAIAEDADALLLATSVKSINEAISVAQANQNRLPLLGSHSLYTSETIEIGKATVANLVLPTPWLPETDSENDFSQTSKELWGGRVNWRTAMAYDATEAIIEGLKQSNNRAELQSVLTKPNFSVRGATGTFRFQRGDRLSKIQLAYIGKPQPSSKHYQFLPLNIGDRLNRFSPQTQPIKNSR